MTTAPGTKLDLDALAPIDYPAHVARARQALESAEISHLIVTNKENIRWLTGFTGSYGMAILSPDRLVLVTDGRYTTQAPAQLEAAGVTAQCSATVSISSNLIEVAVAQTAGGSRVSAEADHMTWGTQRRFVDKLSVDLYPTEELLLKLRAVKDQGEIERMQLAAQITDAALGELCPHLADGWSEREFGFQLDTALRRHGAKTSAYETIVAAGPNGAMPHARPSDRQIQHGDLVVIDVGSLVDGYRSDMTRSFVVGEPTAEQQRQFDVVLQAQTAAKAALAPGVVTSAIDAAAREVITEAGWGPEFSHGTGHGVGLDIHELPRVGSTTTDVLEANMLVTVEPGVYIAGQSGVRWEDLMLITSNGAEPITHSPKEPLIRG